MISASLRLLNSHTYLIFSLPVNDFVVLLLHSDGNARHTQVLFMMAHEATAINEMVLLTNV